MGNSFSMCGKVSSKIFDIFSNGVIKKRHVYVALSKTDFIRSPKSDVLIMSSGSVPIEAKRAFFKNFIAKNPHVENVIRNAKIEHLGQSGLPLKYPREKFIGDIDKIVKGLDVDKKNALFEKIGMVPKFDDSGKFVSYEGLPVLDNLDKGNPLQKAISNTVTKFTTKNSVITRDSEFNKAFNSLLGVFPEFVNLIGKKQHNDTQIYSVDLHILKVLKEALKHPDYEKLTDKDKTVMKFSILFHDFSKKEGIVDTTHPQVSANYARNLLEKINMPIEQKDRIYELVKNHHWLVDYTRHGVSAEETATKFRNPNDYSIAKIFAASDLKGVNDSYFTKYGSSLSLKNLAPITNAVKHISNTGNIIMTSRIIAPSNIPAIVHNGKTYNVLNFCEIPKNVDLGNYGFLQGTQKNDLRFCAHFLSRNDLYKSATMTKQLADVSSGGVFSTSILSLENKKSISDKKYGVIFNIENNNIANASPDDIGSGHKKTFEEFSMFLNPPKKFSFFNGPRVFLKEKLTDAMIKKNDYKLSSDEYGQVYKQIFSKKHLSQIKDVKIDEKIINADTLKSAIKSAEDSLLSNNKYNEVVVYNPKISAVICKENAIENIPQSMLDFAHENKYPIILIGE